jgi:hypothetical protein
MSARTLLPSKIQTLIRTKEKRNDSPFFMQQAHIIRATSGYGSGSSSPASSAALLRFRPYFPLPLITSFAAHVVRAALISSKLITFAFLSTTNLVNWRTWALLLILVKN